MPGTVAEQWKGEEDETRQEASSNPRVVRESEWAPRLANALGE